MANVLLARGGTPDFKGYFCDGQYAEFNPPYDAPNQPGTPPFDSHGDGAQGQGFLNAWFPLVPNLEGTYAHNWMQSALKKITAVNDVIFTNWIPFYSYVDSLLVVVKDMDARLDGVYVTPVAYRITWDATLKDYVYTPSAEFEAEMTTAGVTQLPIGTAAAGDKQYALARLWTDPTKLPSTFGVPYDGDAASGAIVIGLKITQGDPAKIATIWRSNIAVYVSAKFMAFESAVQVG